LKKLIIKTFNIFRRIFQKIKKKTKNFFTLPQQSTQSKMNDQHFGIIGFNIANGLIDDEYLFFRALSDEFFGHQNYFVDIIRNLCLYLGIFEARVNQRIENTGRFQDCELLRSFSLIYRCQINVHQMDREVIRIGENGKNTRVINILFHNNRYASLIRI